MDANFLGGSYSSRSIAIDGQETMNWYPEVIEEPTGNNTCKLALIPTPGLILFTGLSD